MKAVSVGFNPLEWNFVQSKERPFGIDFIKQELLEISPCPVPCNANALIEARAKGIDTAPLVQWAERILDEGDMTFIPRELLVETYRAAKTPKASTPSDIAAAKESARQTIESAREAPQRSISEARASARETLAELRGLI